MICLILEEFLVCFAFVDNDPNPWNWELETLVALIKEEKVSLPRNGIGSQWLSDPPLGMAVTIRACHMHRCSGPQKIPVQDFYGGNNFRESEWPTPGNGGKTVKVAMLKHKIHITVTNPPGNGGNRTPGHLHKLMAHPGQRCHVWCSKCFSLLLNC